MLITMVTLYSDALAPGDKVGYFLFFWSNKNLWKLKKYTPVNSLDPSNAFYNL